MFSDDILCKIFAHEEMQKIPVGCQSTAVHVFEEILEDTEKIFLNPTTKRQKYCHVEITGM